MCGPQDRMNAYQWLIERIPLRLTVARDLGKRPAAQRFLAFADTEVFSWAPSCLVGRLSRVGSNRNPAWSLRSLISFLVLHPGRAP